MKTAKTTDAPWIVTSIWPGVLLLLIGVAAFVTASGYGATSARFPLMVATAMIVLALFDLWSRTRLPGARTVEIFGGTSFHSREMMHNPTFAIQAECIGWIIGAFVLMATIGLLATSAIFCTAFVRIRGNLSLKVSAGVGLGVLMFQYGVFEWALEYELYRGLPFSEGGLADW